MAVSRNRAMTILPTLRKDLFEMESDTLVPKLSRAGQSTASGKAPIDFCPAHHHFTLLL